MNPPAAGSRWVKAIKRGIAGLFVFGGLLRLVYWSGDRIGMEGPLTAALLAVVGVGIVKHWRWARLLAMGACFLAIVLASATPAWLYFIKPDAGAAGLARAILLFSPFIAAFGYLGYKGLEYFRSEQAHQDYSNHGGQLAALRAEGSRFVVYTALGWLMLSMVLIGLNLEARERRARLSTPPPVQPAKVGALPDLVVTRLCLNHGGQVMAEIENRGEGSDDRAYQISFTDRQFRNDRYFSGARVPDPGKRGLVALNRTFNQDRSVYAQRDVDVEVDAGRWISESDEANNSGRFALEFQSSRPVNLPSCESAAPPEGLPSLDSN